MRKIWEITGKRVKVALILCLIALICSTVGLFFLKEELRYVTWVLLIVWVINYWEIVEENIKLRKEQIAKDYEIDSLKWSYMEMGRYINKFQIDELSDIDFRIENELRDIEIRKQNFME